MEQYLKVSGHDNLVRDMSSKAVINTSMSEYEEYMALRKAKEQEQQLIANQTEEINNLKSDISEIKQMLQMLIKDR
jgi:wobble nucleotide-excising tRNase